MNFPKDILIVTPNFFNLEYKINNHMDLGQKIDRPKALQQWETLKEIYLKLGLNVIEIEGQKNYPDMVFCANTIFSTRNSWIYSKMRHSQREGEVTYFKNQFPGGYQMEQSFEAMGDLIIDYENEYYFGGYGYRTSQAAYEEIEKILKLKIKTLNLINANFYHLDTCLSIINKSTALYVESAFEKRDIAFLKSTYQNLIKVDEEEALKFLACNAFSPDGKNIILEKNAHKLKNSISAKNFIVHECDTSEYLKAGGSIFCMKNMGWFRDINDERN